MQFGPDLYRGQLTYLNTITIYLDISSTSITTLALQQVTLSLLVWRLLLRLTQASFERVSKL